MNGVDCYHWVDRNFNDLVRIYVAKATRGERADPACARGAMTVG